MKALRIIGLALLALCLLAMPARAYTEPKEMRLLASYKVAGAGNDIEWSPDGRWIALTNGSNITVIDPIDGEVVDTFWPVPGLALSVGWAYDQSWIGFSTELNVYACSYSHAGTSMSCYGRHFAWSPAGPWFATDWNTSTDHNITVHEDIRGAHIQSLPTDGKSVDSLAFSPDGLRLAAVLDRNEIRIWNVTNGTSIHYPPDGWLGTISSIAWSPDGLFLLAGANDPEGPFNLRLLFSTDNATDAGGLSYTEYGPSNTNCVDWAPDGTMASGQEDGSVFLTGYDADAPEGSPRWWAVHAIGYPAGPVTSLDWSSDGRFLATASTDGTVNIWGAPGSLPEKPRLRLALEAERDTVYWGKSVNLTLRLSDNLSAPLKGAAISLSCPDGGSFSAVVDSGDGNYTATFTAPRPGAETGLTLSAGARKPGFMPANGSVQLRVLPPPVNRRTAEPPVHVADNSGYLHLFSGGTLIILAAALAATETGKYSGMALFIPLFTRMKKQAVLDNFTRGQLHGYITANPGAHMNAMRDRFGLSNGEVAYHLRVLEREGLVSSMSDGLKRRFYPGERAERPGAELSEAQKLLIFLMEKNPGATGVELARLAGSSPQVVNYHLKRLWRMDLITMDRDGRAVRCAVRPDRLAFFKRAPAGSGEAPEENPFTESA